MNRYGNYTVSDVSKILRVDPVTVRNWINAKKLKALGADEPIVPGKRRHLEIRRDDLIDFLSLNKSMYDHELLRAYGINLVEESELPESVYDYYEGGKKPKPKTATEIDPDAEYTVSDISELKGAWAPEQPKVSGTVCVAESAPVSAPAVESPHYICSVVVDGRIAVANVEPETALAIMQAMLADKRCQFKGIEVRRALEQ